ncbi:hypothetical protein Tco_0876650 [Tanacetum coccineum]|uniref:Uncharacterized protein n=1 Tax=Tanacetum coccineum TaxID=301880 RepID=A0ABQ5BUL1_9ASTR
MKMMMVNSSEYSGDSEDSDDSDFDIGDEDIIGDVNGFKAGKRDLLGLDGCFLSGPYPGQILTVVGVDPDNRIYPLAICIGRVRQRSHGYGSWTVLEMTWSCSETPTSPSYQIGKRGQAKVRAGGTVTCLKCGQQGQTKDPARGQRHQGSTSPPQASQASSQASQGSIHLQSQDHKLRPSSSQSIKNFTRFTKSTGNKKRRMVQYAQGAVSASSDHVNAGAIENGNEGSSKPPSGSKEIYRPRSVPKSILEWYGYDSVADYHADADYVPKKKVKSPGPIAVLGLPNKVTWMDIELKKWELGVLYPQERQREGLGVVSVMVPMY